MWEWKIEFAEETLFLSASTCTGRIRAAIAKSTFYIPSSPFQTLLQVLAGAFARPVIN